MIEDQEQEQEYTVLGIRKCAYLPCGLLCISDRPEVENVADRFAYE